MALGTGIGVVRPGSAVSAVGISVLCLERKLSMRRPRIRRVDAPSTVAAGSLRDARARRPATTLRGWQTSRRPGPRDRKPDVGIGTLLAGDGVRGVGALFVFTTHVCLLADPVPNNNLLSYGWAAPILGHIDLALSAFFVLSGYLIARPYARAYVAGTRRPRLRNYVRNRVLRVVPVFYLLSRSSCCCASASTAA